MGSAISYGYRCSPRLPLEDFDAISPGWKYVGGEEFPGAKGSLTLDTTTKHSGRDVKELRLWVRSSTRGSFGIRLADGSDQVHQRHITLPAGANDGKWHAPLKGLGINVGRSVEAGKKDLTPAEVWFDDRVAVLAEPVRR